MDYQSQLNQVKHTTSVFTDAPEHMKARDDFRYICEQSNLTTAPNLKYVSILKNSVKIADSTVVALDLKKGTVAVPSEYVNTEDLKMYLAVVCYADGQAVDVLLVNGAALGSCKKFVKYDKKSGEYVLKVKDIKKDFIRKHAFGLVIAQL